MPGRVMVWNVRSRVLRGNPLGDPTDRSVPVYLPPSYDRDPGRRYPVIYFITGFTGRGLMALNVAAWGENIPERMDRLIATGKMQEAIVVAPDCFTKYGGSQYLNSSATGRYEDHVVKEIVPWADAQFRTIPKAGARAILGKSSGGYGAIILGMRRPDVLGWVADHSGDSYFEYCYLPDIPKYLTYLPRRGKTTAGFLRHFFKAPNKTHAELGVMINMVAMASCYSPNPRTSLGFDLPFDEKTREFRPDVWARWRRWDPVNLVDRYAANLRRLKGIFLDCGTRDEWSLHHGTYVLAQKLRAKGLDVTHEEFDDGHLNIPYRYDRSFAWLSRGWKRLGIGR